MDAYCIEELRSLLFGTLSRTTGEDVVWMITEIRTGACLALMHLLRSRGEVPNHGFQIMHLFVSPHGMRALAHEGLLLALIAFVDIRGAEVLVQNAPNAPHLSKFLLAALGFLKSDACSLLRPLVHSVCGSYEQLVTVQRQFNRLLTDPTCRPSPGDKSADLDQNRAAPTPS